jgi:hypothetical protein
VSLSKVILHLEQGLDLVEDARVGYFTIVSLELDAWLVALRRHVPTIADLVTVTSDADGLAQFAALLTLTDLDGLLHSDPLRIRSLIVSSIAFLRTIAAYTDLSQRL